MNEETRAPAGAEAAGKSRNFLEQWIEEDVLAGRTGGKVVTRFPPEPNGYLHIGHAKAICVDFGLAAKFGGECHLRLDDTNPSKESDEFAENIKEDIHWLGFDWGEHFYSAADRFETMWELAERLVKRGLAYVCFLSQEEWKKHRGVPTEPGIPSPWRDTPPEENLARFRDMRAGKYADGECCLRAKIDMASPNIHFRDPVIYRINRLPHYHLGDKWCVYPMYDFAHPIEDALEGVTHSMCSLEFEVHRPLYDWVVDRMAEEGMLMKRGGIEVRPHQREFSRLNITHTVMSKRKLRELVDLGLVAGWDDPRMPTLCGMRRRGYPAEAIRTFCERAGVTKFISTTDMSLLEQAVRDVLNKTAPRRMAVLDPVKLVIENMAPGETRECDAVNNPEDLAAGSRRVVFGRELWVERADFMKDPPKKFYRLAPGREVRLKYACLFTCTGFSEDGNGNVTEIRGTWDPGSLGGNAPDGRSVRGTIHWVDATTAAPLPVRLYDRLFSVENPEADDARDFKEFLNPDSCKDVTALCEPALRDARPEDGAVQFERLGYFRPDPVDSAPGAPVFNRTVTLRDSWAKISAKA